MSRSTKKTYVHIAGFGRGSIAKWKNQCNKRVRSINVEQEIPQGRHYKKINTIWDRPDDGMHYWDHPKAIRK